MLSLLSEVNNPYSTNIISDLIVSANQTYDMYAYHVDLYFREDGSNLNLLGRDSEYDIDWIDSLKTSLQEQGVLNPIIYSKKGILDNSYPNIASYRPNDYCIRIYIDGSNYGKSLHFPAYQFEQWSLKSSKTQYIGIASTNIITFLYSKIEPEPDPIPEPNPGTPSIPTIS